MSSGAQPRLRSEVPDCEKLRQMSPGRVPGIQRCARESSGRPGRCAKFVRIDSVRWIGVVVDPSPGALPRGDRQCDSFARALVGTLPTARYPRVQAVPVPERRDAFDAPVMGVSVRRLFVILGVASLGRARVVPRAQDSARARRRRRKHLHLLPRTRQAQAIHRSESLPTAASPTAKRVVEMLAVAVRHPSPALQLEADAIDQEVVAACVDHLAEVLAIAGARRACRHHRPGGTSAQPCTRPRGLGVMTGDVVPGVAGLVGVRG